MQGKKHGAKKAVMEEHLEAGVVASKDIESFHTMSFFALKGLPGHCTLAPATGSVRTEDSQLHQTLHPPFHCQGVQILSITKRLEMLQKEFQAWLLSYVSLWTSWAGCDLEHHATRLQALITW